MNNEDNAINQITNFIKSNDVGLLLTGTHQYEKHLLVMRIINKHFTNAKILFRINSMQNITGDSFVGLKKQPKAGEFVKIGSNYYSFDSFNSKSTWQKTSSHFDFAILYPIDALCRSQDINPIKDLFKQKSIKKSSSFPGQIAENMIMLNLMITSQRMLFLMPKKITPNIIKEYWIYDDLCFVA